MSSSERWPAESMEPMELERPPGVGTNDETPRLLFGEEPGWPRRVGRAGCGGGLPGGGGGVMCGRGSRGRPARARVLAVVEAVLAVALGVVASLCWIRPTDAAVQDELGEGERGDVLRLDRRSVQARTEEFERGLQRVDQSVSLAASIKWNTGEGARDVA